MILHYVQTRGVNVMCCSWIFARHVTKSLTAVSLVNYTFMVIKALLRWIKNFLTNRSHQVIIDNKRSDSCNVLSGVPQGTVLAPLLFWSTVMTSLYTSPTKYAFMLMMLFCIHTSTKWTTAVNYKKILTPSHIGHISGKCTLMQGSVNS